jgi:uncharacterized damage-inducible protein DinB
MPPRLDLRASLLAAWRTNNRVTRELIENLPPELWKVVIPGTPRKTVRAIAAHLHNSRCGWLRTLGREHGIKEPGRVDPNRVTPKQVITALKQSSAGMESLLELGLACGGELPPSRGYVWRNLALDVGHVLTYFVGHEAHHRGQIVMIARQTGHRLPNEVTARLWWWKQKSTTETRKHGEKQKQFATDERSYAASTRAKTNHKGHEGTKNRRDPPVIADIGKQATETKQK